MYASLIVESLCAITNDVISFEIKFIDCKILPSDFESKLDVASSNNIILGFFNTALAMAIRCFSPPDNFRPLSPTIVSYLSGRLFIKWCILANVAAFITSSLSDELLAYCILKKILSLKRTVSWGTTAIFL